MLYLKADLSNVNVKVLLGIDVGLYLGFGLLKEFVKGWSFFGLSFKMGCLKINTVLIVQRVVLRLVSALCVLVIFVNYMYDFLALLPFNLNVLYYTAVPFFGMRIFKRCVAESVSFTLHFSLFLSLILFSLDKVGQASLVVLMMPLYPNWIWSAFLSVFQIP